MIELVVGGTRSGKSRYALDTAQSMQGRHVFIATAEAGDQEMKDRISRHQQEREGHWDLIEEPRSLSGVIFGLSAGDVAVIDCLTLWLSNWLCSGNYEGWRIEKTKFLDAIETSDAEIVLVSNETGMGVVPMGQLSREFVDESGRLHQEIATRANRVTLVMLGIPQYLKP